MLKLDQYHFAFYSFYAIWVAVNLLVKSYVDRLNPNEFRVVRYQLHNQFRGQLGRPLYNCIKKKPSGSGKKRKQNMFVFFSIKGTLVIYKEKKILKQAIHFIG